MEFLYNNKGNLRKDLAKNFFINKTTGEVCVRNKQMLDRELRNKYEFLVTASNLEVQNLFINNWKNLTNFFKPILID